MRLPSANAESPCLVKNPIRNRPKNRERPAFALTLMELQFRGGSHRMVREFMGQKRTEKLLALGEANVTVLGEMKRWCKHFDAKQTTAGMMAQMSGLPIASFRLSCPHAKFIPEG